MKSQQKSPIAVYSLTTNNKNYLLLIDNQPYIITFLDMSVNTIL